MFFLLYTGLLFESKGAAKEFHIAKTWCQHFFVDPDLSLKPTFFESTIFLNFDLSLKPTSV